MQNVQPTAQPTCVETHTPSPGSSTLSTVLPSSSASRKRTDASAPRCSESTRTSAPKRAVSTGSSRRNAQRKLRVFALRERVEREPAHPRAQHQRLVARPRARGPQRFAQLVK